MKFHINHPSTQGIARMAAGFRRDLSRLLKNLSRAEELADRLWCTYNELMTALLAQGPTAANLFSLAVTPAESTGKEHILKLSAEANISAIKSVAQADGSRLIHLDGRAGVPLTSNLADLLDVLKTDTGDSPDQLVSWKPLSGIVESLKARTGEDFTKKAVRQLIYRLRNQLECHGENRLLVQSDRRIGYRFALRRASISRETCDAM